MASVQVTLLEPKLLRERGRRERVVIEEDEMILHVKIWKHLQNRMDSLYSSCITVSENAKNIDIHLPRSLFFFSSSYCHQRALCKSFSD